jgi:hypothetical protein
VFRREDRSSFIFQGVCPFFCVRLRKTRTEKRREKEKKKNIKEFCGQKKKKKKKKKKKTQQEKNQILKNILKEKMPHS